MPDTNSRGNDTGSNYMRLFVFGFAFVLTLGLLAVIGLVVDRLLGTLPLFLLIGLGLGFVAWMYNLYLALKKFGGG